MDPMVVAISSPSESNPLGRPWYTLSGYTPGARVSLETTAGMVWMVVRKSVTRLELGARASREREREREKELGKERRERERGERREGRVNP